MKSTILAAILLIAFPVIAAEIPSDQEALNLFKRREQINLEIQKLSMKANGLVEERKEIEAKLKQYIEENGKKK